MVADDYRRLYLWRVKSVLEESKEHTFDVYNKDGYFIHRIKMGIVPDLLKNGYLCDIEEDEETGKVFVKRYRVRNWGQIKEGI